MANQFSRLASHFSNYWKDKGTEAPEMSFNIKAIEKAAEEKFKDEESTNTPKPSEDKPKKEKDLGILGMISDMEDTVDKAIEAKVKTVIGRVIDDKLRSTFSKDISIFEKSVANKVQGIVDGLKTKVLNDLKTLAPDVGKEVPKKEPTDFTEVTMNESEDKDKDNWDRTSAIEVYPNIYVVARKEDQNIGDIYVKASSKLLKMRYTVDLPETQSRSEYITKLQENLDTLLK